MNPLAVKQLVNKTGLFLFVGPLHWCRYMEVICTGSQMIPVRKRSTERKSSQDSGKVENTRLRLVFSTFPSCSQMPVVFYHSVMHGLGFFIC